MLLGGLARASPRRGRCCVIVPRHPQRFDEVAELVADAGFTLARRSAWADDEPPAEPLAADVWLGDSMREMPLYYALADVALLGGSFAPLGGQNLIEAAACGCPVVMGPHTFNFERGRRARARRRRGDARRRHREPASPRPSRWRRTDPPARDEGRGARSTSRAQHRGAAARMASASLPLSTRRRRARPGAQQRVALTPQARSRRACGSRRCPETRRPRASRRAPAGDRPARP